MPSRRKRPSTAPHSTTKGNRNQRQGKPPPNAPSYDSVCRVCMRWSSGSGSSMVGLLDRQVQGIKLAELLALVGAVDMATEDDKLPKWCCKQCLKRLDEAYELRLLCQASDRKLRDAFADVEAVVVKEEFDMDELNPLDEMNVDCKPDMDEIRNVGATVVPDNITLPKLEIVDNDTLDEEPGMEEDRLSETHDLADNLGCVDAEPTGDDGEDAEDKEEPKQANEPGKPNKYPDVFDEVPVVGFRCCGCKNKFDTLEDLKAHALAYIDKKLTKKQLKKRVQCDICCRVLSNTSALQCHKSLGTVNFRCKVCGDIFRSRRRVCRHHEAVHGANPKISGPSRICCACLEKFETEEQLREHSTAVHLPEKPPPDPTRPFICNVCYRSYSSDAYLYAHQSRMLKVTKKHMCVECGMMFKHPGLLRDHEGTHTGEKLYQCSHCPASYYSKDSFRKHVKRHLTPADKFKCEICGYSYKNATGLKEHIATHHTGERPHKCPHCPASFARNSSLNSHMLSHSIQKRQTCPLCGKQFKRDSEVKHHVDFFHHKLKPFPCFFCPKEYPRKDYRKRHMVNAHPEELRNNPIPPIELYGSLRWNKVKHNVESVDQPSSNE